MKKIKTTRAKFSLVDLKSQYGEQMPLLLFVLWSPNISSALYNDPAGYASILLNRGLMRFKEKNPIEKNPVHRK